jgi:hypothetical protein
VYGLAMLEGGSQPWSSTSKLANRPQAEAQTVTPRLFRPTNLVLMQAPSTVDWRTPWWIRLGRREDAGRWTGGLTPSCPGRNAGKGQGWVAFKHTMPNLRRAGHRASAVSVNSSHVSTGHRGLYSAQDRARPTAGPLGTSSTHPVADEWGFPTGHDRDERAGRIPAQNARLDQGRGASRSVG